jgi:hypothetical protein
MFAVWRKIGCSLQTITITKQMLAKTTKVIQWTESAKKCSFCFIVETASGINLIKILGAYFGA